MRIFDLESAQAATGQVRSWLYNAVDCVGTRQIFDVLFKRADARTIRTYSMERAVQNPAIAMSLRGIRVNEISRDRVRRELQKELTSVEKKIANMPEITSVWDKLEKVTGECPNPTRKDRKHKWEKGPDTVERKCSDCGCTRLQTSVFNANSSDQVSHLYYGLFKCKAQYNAQHKVSTDEDCLGRLRDKYPKFRAVSEAILSVRDLKKQLGFMKAELKNGRYHSSFNVGAALTGRWSSNKFHFKYGGNAQNITERHRHIFVADVGKTLFYADLKQAESNIVAHLAGDEQYIEAHRAGDTHTYVCRLVWPEGVNGTAWTGDLKTDRELASSARPAWDNVPGHDYRFQAKAVQHGSNLGLTPMGLAMQKHIPLRAAQEAQERYFRAFPGIREWQFSIKQKVENMEPIINPIGVRTLLHGRPMDPSTYKQGLAINPQGLVAHLINFCLEQIYHALDPGSVQLLAQVHDAILGQTSTDKVVDTMRQVYDFMRIPVPITDIYGVTRLACIEPEIAIGFNWGHASETNPEGLRELHL